MRTPQNSFSKSRPFLENISNDNYALLPAINLVATFYYEALSAFYRFAC